MIDMYCLDTNIIIDLFRGDERLRTQLEKLKDLNVEVSMAMPSLLELYKGAYASSKKEQALQLIGDFKKSVKLLPVSEQSCVLFGMDWCLLKKKGKPVPEFDLFIASIAKAEGKIFVTRNQKHFLEIPNLKIEEW
ncbi:PIN domain-containing protein [Candidatus Woesearchaeota archaeon]|nr:PIN domain-containing protein [Candidatus Woesearchaeota archaeon]